MAKHGKKYLAAAAKIDPNQNYTPAQAIALAHQTSTTKFDATVEIHMRLGVDPRHADQQVRDVVVLPHGLGKNGARPGFCPGRWRNRSPRSWRRFRGG